VNDTEGRARGPDGRAKRYQLPLRFFPRGDEGLRALALLAVLAVLALVASGGTARAQGNETEGTVSWSPAGEPQVVLPRLPEFGVQLRGYVLNAFYVSDRQVRVVSYAYDKNICPPSITVVLADLYDPSKSTSVAVNPSNADVVVSVWSNATAIYLIENGVVTSAFKVVRLSPVAAPQGLSWLSSLVPVALLIAFGARGKAREAGLGLVAAGIAIPMAVLLGGDPVACNVIGAASIIVGLLILALAGERE